MARRPKRRGAPKAGRGSIKIPRSQRSKYDPARGRDDARDKGPASWADFKGMTLTGKIPYDPRQEARDGGHVQGCGDPDCKICMPDDPANSGAIDAGDGDATTFFIGGSDFGRVQEEMVRRFARLSSRQWDERWEAINFGPRADPANHGRSRLRDAEAAARKPVQHLLLQASHATAFDDVVGNRAARQAIVDAIETPMHHAGLYATYGKRPARGVLLHGPPGNGKTMLGKAAAAAVQRLSGGDGAATARGEERGTRDREASMILINGPSIQSPYVGVTEQVIRNVFAYARAYAALHRRPLVVFIDEADAILPPRDGRSLPWEVSNVATFLAEMDGLEGSGAFVILATNRPHAIDAALTRDGRCDRRIKVERPDREAAREILGRALRGSPLAAGATVAKLAEAGAAAAFDPSRAILKVCTRGEERGTGDRDATMFLTLGDCVSGAMMVGVAERAKQIALDRDVAGQEARTAGGRTGKQQQRPVPSGIGAADVVAAVDAAWRETAGLDQSYALEEFCERHGIKAALAERVALPSPGDLVDLSAPGHPDPASPWRR